MANTFNRFFKPGLLSVVMDGGSGSSGKGKVASYVTENADNWTFACNTFAPQAGHWVRLDDGKQFFYQTFNGCAYNTDKYEKIYVGPGGMLELPAFFREIEENKIPVGKVGISPMTMILEDFDADFERGTKGFDNTPATDTSGTIKYGSTCHGVGSAAARRMLRRGSVRLAKDIPELKQYVCDVPGEIMARLDNGESGLLEIAQGFQLSLLYDKFYPHTTSRQVTVAQAMSDMMLPTKYAGPVLINFRTYPIRINSNKYVSKVDGRHLTWAEIESGTPYTVIEGNSGHWYPDQQEISWAELTALSGSPTPIMEITSVTKLPRRVATFSKQNVIDSIKYNDTGWGVTLSINFMNYVDHTISGAKTVDKLTPKVTQWLSDNLGEHMSLVKIIGTGAKTSESIVML